MKDQWLKNQKRVVVKALQEKWGNGWNLLTLDHQEAEIMRSILRLILAQDLEKYKPAQEMIEALLDSFNFGEKDV